MSTLLALLDGAVDHPHPKLGGRTPLEAAELTFIDSLAEMGTKGTTDGREYTHIFLLELLSGNRMEVPRGLIEAIGLKMDVTNGRSAHRFSPASVVNGKVDWLYGLTDEEVEILNISVIAALPLLERLSPEICFCGGGKGVLVMDPIELRGLPSPPGTGTIDMDGLGKMRDFVTSIPEGAGGMTVLPWGGGNPVSCDMHRLLDLIKPLTVVSNSPSALGVGGHFGAGMTLIEDMADRVGEARRSLQKGNVLLHFEEIDEVSHRRDPLEKVALLERADKLLEENFSGHDDILIIVDHGTSCLTGEHLAVPVPFIYSKKVDVHGHVPLGSLLTKLLG